MMHIIPPFTAFILCLTTSMALAQQGAVGVEGTTSYYRDRDDRGNSLPEAQRGYQPLANVRVIALRRSVIGTDMSRLNGNDATYGLKIAEGAPFHVLFQEDKLVPELKTLTADPKKPQRIHVTLLTPRQFDEIFGREELVNHLKKIMRILRRTEGIGADELKRLETLFSQQFDVDTSER